MVEDFSTQFIIRKSTVWLVGVISDTCCINMTKVYYVKLDTDNILNLIHDTKLKLIQ